MPKLKKYPADSHPEFKHFWNKYSEMYNDLTENMSGDQVSLLHKVLEAVKDIERLGFQLYLNGIGGRINEN